MLLHRIKQSNMTYYNGRKQHFPCWWWCSRVLNRSNAQKIFYDINLRSFIWYVPILWPIFQSFPHSPLVRTCIYLEYPSLLHVWSHQSDTPSPILTLLIYHSFLIINFLKFMNLWLTLSSIQVFLSRKSTILSHPIQFPVAYLGRPFR